MLIRQQEKLGGNPGLQAAELIRMALESTLLSMGIDTRGKSEEDISLLLDDARILIRDIEQGSSSGIYIFRVITRIIKSDIVEDVIPKWYISDPYINRDLKVTIQLWEIEKDLGKEISYNDKLKVKH